MKQYIELVQNVLNNGTIKKPSREGQSSTLGLSFGLIQHNLSDGFPLLTTKKMSFKNIFYELKWFLMGDTNIKYLVDRNVNIWNEDAYRFYLNKIKQSNLRNNDMFEDKPLSLDDFISNIKNDTCVSMIPNYHLGDCGKIYGYQLRKREIDQFDRLIKNLSSNPTSRYHIINMWNIKDTDINDSALPPCHVFYQFIIREENNITFLDLNLYQRSADLMLGVPYNVASMSLLCHIVSNMCNMTPGTIRWIGGDVHIYEEHINNAKKQISRIPMILPQIKILKNIKNINNDMELENIELLNYNCYLGIDYKLNTGLTK